MQPTSLIFWRPVHHCARQLSLILGVLQISNKIKFFFFEKNSPHDRTPQYDISSFANQQQDFENQLQLRQLSLILDIEIDIGYRNCH